MKDPQWAKKKARQKRIRKQIVQLAREGQSPMFIQEKTGAELSHIAKHGAPFAECPCGNTAIEIHHNEWICRACYLPDNIDRDATFIFYLSRQNCALGLYVAKTHYVSNYQERRSK